MAGAGEDEAPPPPLDGQTMDEAAAGELSRFEQHHGASDAPSSPPSFRMEDLPPEIQTVVVSLLPLKEVVRASIVSRSWRMLWACHSNLCFYFPKYDPCFERDYPFDRADDPYFDDLIKHERAKFIDAVNGIIQQHSGIGINKFSISCGLHKEDLHHLDSWIGFAASSKANIMKFDMNKLYWESEKAHHFPLEALHVQGGSCVQSLFLAAVSIKQHSGICGFTILRRLVLEYVQIFGDFPSLLANCSALEDLAIIACPGVANLSIPHKLDKLHHLLIGRMSVEMIEFHAANLAHFEYRGRVIPIVLHGCSKLEKATIGFHADKALGQVFTAVPSILSVKILNVEALVTRDEQLQKLTTRPHGMFMHLRHITCQLTVVNCGQNDDNGVLQLAYCLDIAPHLETLHLDMFYSGFMDCKSDEVVGEGSYMHRHDHLKTVYISGFQLYKAQTMLACCILANASVLEHLKIEPRFGSGTYPRLNYGLESVMPEVCKWAHLASKRFGKVITVMDAPSE